MIPVKIRKFIKNFPYGYLGTSDKSGNPNISIKGIVDIDSDRVYFFDLFAAKTKKNLEINKQISFFVINLDSFIGYQLKGTAWIEEKGEIFKGYLDKWEKKRDEFIISRMLDNLKREKITKKHDIHLLKPEYLIVMEVEEVYDLVKPIELLVKSHLDKIGT